MAQFQLATEIVKFSDAATWDAEKTEWALLEFYEVTLAWVDAGKPNYFWFHPLHLSDG